VYAKITGVQVPTYIYARISLDRRDGAGIDRQLEDGRALCDGRGWPITREFVDNSRSAWRPRGRRPDYDELLAAVEAVPACRIVAYKLDRLYRRPRELEDLIDLAESRRIVVATTVGDFDLTTGAGRLLARQIVSTAAGESDNTSERMRRQKQQARERGRSLGGPRPLGWAHLTVTLPDGTEKLTWDVTRHDPDEAEHIRQAVDAVLAGASLGDIRRRWNAEGVQQPQSGRANWKTQGVAQVLGNPRIAGLSARRRPDGVWEVVREGTWPAIVERTKWEQLQLVLAQRGAFGRVPRRRSRFTGLLICGRCQATMVRGSDSRARARDGERRPMWVCPPYATKQRPEKGCGRVAIDADGVEDRMVGAALEAAASLDLVKLAAERSDDGREAARLVEELAELDRRADEAAISHAGGRITLRAWERFNAAIEIQRELAQRRLSELAGGRLLAPYLTAPGALAAAWEDLSVDQQRELIRVLVGPVVIMPARPGLRHFDPDRVVPVT
jgi:site-specific DNA recombinase